MTSLNRPTDREKIYDNLDPCHSVAYPDVAGLDRSGSRCPPYCLLSMVEPRRARIRRRAQHACANCHLPQRAAMLPYQVDRIVALFHP